MDLTTLLLFAGARHGVIGRRQLIDALGLSRSQVSRLTKRRTLVPMLPSVYRLASASETFEARCVAALEWAGPQSFVASVSAARLYGLRKHGAERVHIMIPGHASRRRPPAPWVVLERTSWFDDRHVHDRGDGVRVATPLRMMWTLGADVNQFRFDRSAEDAWHLGLTDPSEMADFLRRHRRRGRDGVKRFETFLERCTDRHLPAQSGFEQDLIAALESVLPPVVRQYRLELANGEWIKLDVAWPDIRLAVEPGASWYHGGDAAQARDHDRDLACNEVGWMVIRLDESFRRDLRAAARRVRRVHALRSAELGASPGSE